MTDQHRPPSATPQVSSCAGNRSSWRSPPDPPSTATVSGSRRTQRTAPALQPRRDLQPRQWRSRRHPTICRVGGWRASVRVRWSFRRFRSGPQSGSHGRVSSPPLTEPGVQFSRTGLSTGIMHLAHRRRRADGSGACGRSRGDRRELHGSRPRYRGGLAGHRAC